MRLIKKQHLFLGCLKKIISPDLRLEKERTKVIFKGEGGHHGSYICIFWIPKRSSQSTNCIVGWNPLVSPLPTMQSLQGTPSSLHYVLSDVRGQVFGTDPYVNH